MRQRRAAGLLAHGPPQYCSRIVLRISCILFTASHNPSPPPPRSHCPRPGDAKFCMRTDHHFQHRIGDLCRPSHGLPLHDSSLATREPGWEAPKSRPEDILSSERVASTTFSTVHMTSYKVGYCALYPEHVFSHVCVCVCVCVCVF